MVDLLNWFYASRDLSLIDPENAPQREMVNKNGAVRLSIPDIPAIRESLLYDLPMYPIPQAANIYASFPYIWTRNGTDNLSCPR